jgi:hypothetical protein
MKIKKSEEILGMRGSGFWVLGFWVLGLKERDRSIGDCSIRDSSGIVQLSVPPLL